MKRSQQYIDSVGEERFQRGLRKAIKEVVASMGTLKIGRITVKVESLQQASAEYSRLRDESGKGASEWRTGKVVLNGKRYRISYNGKVWDDKPWVDGDVPVFNPFAECCPDCARPVEWVEPDGWQHVDPKVSCFLYSARS